ncbi:MAG: F420-nonreducing hydrogenase [Deltaproteobacteria bacterium]|nr:hydrogenase iron-sulfur subunit [Deltaproteobacteria bacterium]MBW1928826.1 hydrogenase iron-sulfur subunit [Deltaproteobacteria bacterium]MBW2027251.1 hydrogenase iron-sulfur subunit [Deltaproteobacteria bacterium]MBW2127526.1 hydrogenase iron-sulfur subunit [Deltaproteobacteria bacterium]RLB28766.1 MAG: F420-nonreducing hydrogenase [Deltaproteobacteria bacterium]
MERVIAFFYCQNTPSSTETDRQMLEKKYGKNIRLFPIPCSGRLEPVHILRALESFTDAAYLITCPEGTCRYFEGNLRARKRVIRAQQFITAIGLEKERAGIYMRSAGNTKKLSEIVEELFEIASKLPPSPVFRYSEREV